MTRTALPKTVDIWPLHLLHAQDTKHGGAARLHVLAYVLDHATCNHAANVCHGGSGKVSRKDLETAALELGVKRSTFFTWLYDARKYKILNGEGEYLYLAGHVLLDGIYQCDSQDKRKATIPLKLLFKPGWKSLVWAAYLKANHHKRAGVRLTKTKAGAKMQDVYKGKMIANKTLENITGISPRQQRRYNQFIRTKKNIGITTIAGDWETADTLNQAAQNQGSDRHYFTFNDPQQADPAGFKDYRRVMAHTLPGRRTVADGIAKVGAKGRRRPIGAARKGLRLVKDCNYSSLSSLACTRQAEKQYGTFTDWRIYFDTAEQAAKAEGEGERFIYRQTSRNYRVGVWDVDL